MRSYIKYLAIAVFALAGANQANAQNAQQDINITATVAHACTVNNVAIGSPIPTATIPITAAGAVDTVTAIPAVTISNVACNSPSILTLTSQSGAAVGPAIVAGFTNIINYTASGAWSGATATVNTATVPGSGAAEAGTPVNVATAKSGSLVVTIVPAANALPLVVGTYNDVLRVTLTAN